MKTEHLYEVSVKWQAGRTGIINSPDLKDSIEVVTPPQFPGGIEGVWSPEHLFVAAINSCLMTTFVAIAENSKLDFINFESKALGKVEVIEGKYMISEVTLMPVVTIRDDGKREKAEKVLQKSGLNCLISNSVKSNLIFKPEIKVLTIINTL